MDLWKFLRKPFWLFSKQEINPIQDLFHLRLKEDEFRVHPQYSLKILSDTSFAQFGTKLRKAKSIAEHLRSSGIQKIILTGSRNSNFLAAYTTYFSYLKFYIVSVVHSFSHDDMLNFHIIKKFSNEIYEIKPTEKQTCLDSLTRNHPDAFLVPGYGLHPAAISGLFDLWDIIGKNLFHVKQIYLDIGSGLTFLSLIRYFQEKQRRENFSQIMGHNGDRPELIGISIGRKSKPMQRELAELYGSFFGEEMGNYRILDPLVSPGFSKRSVLLDSYISEKKKMGLRLEPLYSAKSLYTIENFIRMENLPGTGLYLHQGGISNFWRMYL